MAAADQDPAALKRLQDEIYRDKVLRAREMTGEERWMEAIELTNEVFERMLAGAMWQLETDDREVGWAEVRRRMNRLCKTHDHRLYVAEGEAVYES